jgi:hypothetical protein
LSCEIAAIGEYKNPTGGAVGEGVTDNFATTNCSDVACPEESGLEVQLHSKACRGRPCWSNRALKSCSKQRGHTGFWLLPDAHINAGGGAGYVQRQT